MFLDRDDTLKKLNTLYDQPGFHYINLYADAGMGKTTFLRQFTQNKKFLYFKPLAAPEKENFQLLKNLLLRMSFPQEKISAAGRFAELFRTIGKSAKEEPLVFILDDFMQLTNKNRRLFTLIQSYLKKEWTKSNLFVILCKPFSALEKESSESHDVILRPFSFFESRLLFPDFSIEDQIRLYSITGGVPGYMKFFQNGRLLEDNLRLLFFSETGDFYRLPETFLRYRCSNPQMAHCALAAMGDQRRKLHEICERTNLTPSAASSLLSSLESIGIVKKIIPVTESEGSRRTLYKISDGVFRFWYTWVFPVRDLIEMRCSAETELFTASFSSDFYFKDTFENICRQFLSLLQKNGDAPFPYQRAGSWWGQHPTKKRTEYVPIAAADDTNILLGTCFWTDEWIDLDGLKQLQKHGSLFPHRQKWYFLFAKSDFVAGMETLYGDSVKVFTLDNMCRYAKNPSDNGQTLE